MSGGEGTLESLPNISLRVRFNVGCSCSLDSSGNKDKCTRNLVGWCSCVPTNYCYLKCSIDA